MFHQFPEMKWAGEVIHHLTSVAISGILKCDPDTISSSSSSTASAQIMPSDIRYSLLFQLVESAKEVMQCQVEYVQTQIASSEASTLTLVAFLNSHFHFSYDFVNLWDQISDELPNNTDTENKTINSLQEKWMQIITIESEIVFQSIEKYIEACCMELKQTMTDLLFVNNNKRNGFNWEKDVQWINGIKKTLKVRLLLLSSLLDGTFIFASSDATDCG